MRSASSLPTRSTSKSTSAAARVETPNAGWARAPVAANVRRPEPMNVHEYQAKELLSRFGVSVPKGIPCKTPEEAAKAFTDLGGTLAVVKAQIHAGGRGK